MLDNLLFDLKSVCEQLLPILGAVVLIYLCILLKHAWKLIDQASDTVRNLDPTIKLANQSIEKVQAPLDTAVKLSHTMDEMHDKAVDGISRLSSSAADVLEKMKNRGNEDVSFSAAPQTEAKSEETEQNNEKPADNMEGAAHE